MSDDVFVLVELARKSCPVLCEVGIADLFFLLHNMSF